MKTGKNDMNPAIVIAAYNRAEGLAGLLHSLSRADMSSFSDVSLIISIDGGGSKECLELAENFSWSYGKKEIIRHGSNLGLKKHIMYCGGLSREYGSVLVLEDDLYLSPAFYNYASAVSKYYEAAEDIAGFGLYSFEYNEYAGLPFMPLDDGADTYFIQTAVSWGQIWTKAQWHNFESWHKIKSERSTAYIPEKVLSWSDNSWKKYFIRYMVENNKYFVCPRSSLVTNTGLAGVHQRHSFTELQVPLLIRREKWRFKKLRDSLSIYDAFFELEPHILKQLNIEFAGYDFEIDLYGTKSLRNIRSSHLFSLRECSAPIHSYSYSLLPHEMNIINAFSGDYINFGKTKDFGRRNIMKTAHQSNVLGRNINIFNSAKTTIDKAKRLFKRKT